MAVTNFIWDVENDSYLMETGGSGQTQATYTSEPVEYGSLVSQERAGTTHYYHSDVVGSTRQLTDANESTTDSYDYTAFGESVAQSGSTTNPFRFWGQFGGYSDAELSNEVYIRRRHYLRSEGRWGSVDPIGFVDGINLYAYVVNNPIVFVDPSGLAYGNFCGAGRIAICNAVDDPAPPPFNPKPIDDLDKACMEHDCCLFRWYHVINPCRYFYCNAKLCGKALDPDKTCKTSPDPDKCKDYANVIKVALCRLFDPDETPMP